MRLEKCTRNHIKCSKVVSMDVIYPTTSYPMTNDKSEMVLCVDGLYQEFLCIRRSIHSGLGVGLCIRFRIGLGGLTRTGRESMELRNRVDTVTAVLEVCVGEELHEVHILVLSEACGLLSKDTT